MRLIADGLVDREGVSGLAQQLGYSARQLQRVCMAELGAEPIALARAQRAHTARLLIETSALPMSQLAFAAGFSSIRQFNDTVREVYANTPSELRRRANQRRGVPAAGVLVLRLALRTPWHVGGLFGHLAATAIPGVESWSNGVYWRTLRLVHGGGVVGLTPHDDHVSCRLELDDLRDLTAAVSRCRSLLDLDADPVAIDEALSGDRTMRKLITQGSGRRIPGTVDAEEWAIRVVLGQQVSTLAARTHAARLVTALGEPLARPYESLTHRFPVAAAIAAAPDELLKMPAHRRNTVRTVARQIADGQLDLSPGSDRDQARVQLHSIAGVGEWTVGQILLRGLGDPDAFFSSDLGVLGAARDLGIANSARELELASQRWRPWRGYAAQYLWGHGDHVINSLPPH